MSKKVMFGDSIFDAADEAEYLGNVGKRRSDRCQCDSGLTHGTCPGPDNCPNSDRAEQDAPAPAMISAKEIQARFKATTICGHHDFNLMTLICNKCGTPEEKTRCS